MSFLAARWMLKMARLVLLLGVAAATGTAASQSSPEPGSAEVERQLLQRIQDEELQNGPNSRALIDSLTALASHYQEEGEHVLAGAALVRARAIVRIYYGLYSLEEAPLIRELTRSERARGNAPAAWALEQDLLTLAARNTDDLRAVHILREVASARRQVLSRYRAGELPPEIVLGCYYLGASRNVLVFTDSLSKGAGCRSGSRRTVERTLSREATMYDWAATNVILQHPLYANGDLRELQREVQRTCAAYRHDLSFACSNERDVIGTLSYEVGSSVPRIDALVRQADWRIANLPCWWGAEAITSAGVGRAQSCEGVEEAIALYQQAYEELRREGVTQAAIDRVFSPDVPVLLPPVGTNPLTAVEEDPVSGTYVDVAFIVTRAGRAREVELLSTAGRVPRRARFDLVDRIEGSRFRPRMIDGRLADAAPVVVRFYWEDRRSQSLER